MENDEDSVAALEVPSSPSSEEDIEVPEEDTTDMLQEALNAQVEENGKLQGDLVRSKSYNDVLKEELTSLRETLKTMQEDDHDNKDTIIEHLRMEIEQYKVLVAKKDKDIKDNNELIDLLNEESEESKRLLRKKEKELEEFEQNGHQDDTTELTQLQEENAEYKRLLEKKEAEIQQQADEVVQLKKELEGYQQETPHRNESNGVQEEYDALLEKYNRLSDEYKRLERGNEITIVSLQEENELYKGLLEDQNQEKTALEEKILTMEKASDESATDAIQQQLEEYKSIAEKETQKREEYKLIIEKERQQTEEYKITTEGVVARLQKEIDDYKRLSEEATSKVVDLQTQIEDNARKHSSHQQEQQQSTASLISSLKEENEVFKQLLSARRDEDEESSKRNEENEILVAELQQKINDLTRSLEAATRQEQSHKNAIADLQSDVEDYKRLLEEAYDVKERARLLDETVHTLQRELDKTRQALEALTKEYEEYKHAQEAHFSDSKAQLEKDHKEFEDTLKRTQAHVTELFATLANMSIVQPQRVGDNVEQLLRDNIAHLVQGICERENAVEFLLCEFKVATQENIQKVFQPIGYRTTDQWTQLRNHLEPLLSEFNSKGTFHELLQGSGVSEADTLRKELEAKQTTILTLQKEVETLKNAKEPTTARSDDILKLLEKVRQEHLHYTTVIPNSHSVAQNAPQGVSTTISAISTPSVAPAIIAPVIPTPTTSVYQSVPSIVPHTPTRATVNPSFPSPPRRDTQLPVPFLDTPQKHIFASNHVPTIFPSTMHTNDQHYRPRPDMFNTPELRAPQPPSLGYTRSVSPTRTTPHQPPSMASPFPARQPSPPRHQRPSSPPSSGHAYSSHIPSYPSHDPHKSAPVAVLPSLPSQQHNIPRPRSTPTTPAQTLSHEHMHAPTRPLSSLSLSSDHYSIPINPSPSMLPPPSPSQPPLTHAQPTLTHITHGVTAISPNPPTHSLTPSTSTSSSTSSSATPSTPSLLQLSGSSKISDSVEKLRERALEVDRILKSLPRFRTETPTPPPE